MTVITEKTHLDFQNIAGSGEHLSVVRNNLLILLTTVYFVDFQPQTGNKEFQRSKQFSLFC